MGTDGQTAQPDLSSLQQEVLLCGLRMVLFCLLVPIWMHFLCFPGVLECSLATQAAGSRVSALPSLAALPSLVLWTGFYWPFKMYVHLYKHNQQMTESCKQHLPVPPWSPGWQGAAQWPQGISGAQISGLAAAQVQFDPR